MRYEKLIPLLAFSAITFTTSKALADSSTSGPAFEYEDYTNSNNISTSYLGAITLGSGTQVTPIYWGGSRCPNLALPSSTQRQILSEAVIANRVIQVDYQIRNNLLCFTGLSFFSGSGVIPAAK